MEINATIHAAVVFKDLLSRSSQEESNNQTNTNNNVNVTGNWSLDDYLIEQWHLQQHLTIYTMTTITVIYVQYLIHLN